VSLFHPQPSPSCIPIFPLFYCPLPPPPLFFVIVLTPFFPLHPFLSSLYIPPFFPPNSFIFNFSLFTNASLTIILACCCVFPPFPLLYLTYPLLFNPAFPLYSNLLSECPPSLYLPALSVFSPSLVVPQSFCIFTFSM
jgi:hypothetical protein